MARKTVVAKTRNQLDREDHAAQERRDHAQDAAAKRSARAKRTGLLPTLAELRERRNQMTEHELLKLARSAARLELRGAMFSPDDRADVAAAIVADVLAELGGATPRRDAERYQLGSLCKRAQTMRRSIDRTRAREDREAAERAAREALEPAALNVKLTPTPAAHVAIVATAGALAAERAADAVCAELRLPAEHDAPHWAIFYQWARGASGEVCAAERSVTWGTWKVRAHRGAKFVQGFYGAAELLRVLTLGSHVEITRDKNGTEIDRCHVFAIEDRSRDAHGHTPLLADVAHAPHWRERPDVPGIVRKAKLTRAERVHWTKQRARRADAAAQTAAALANLGRALAQSSTRERATRRKSRLDRTAA